MLYEDDLVVAIRDIEPSAPVHYLVLPREHIRSIVHLEDNHKETISKLVFTAKHLAERAGLRGYKLVCNVGREAGQIIDHLHLHLLGGWQRKEDGERMPHPDLDK